MGIKRIKSILFITLSNLGDIILTTPVLEKMHEVFPKARVDVITGAPGEEIFLLHPAVRDVYVKQHHRFLKNRLKQIFYLRKRKYDLVVDLKKTLIPFLLGYFPDMKFGSEVPSLHKRDEHLSRLSSIVTDPFEGAKFFLPIKGSDMLAVEGLVRGCDRKLAIINPGAKSHLKRWPAVKYAELCDRLIEELGMCVYIVGAENDREVVSKVMSSAKREPVDLCSKTSLGTLAAIMKRSEVVVTNDSAPLHVASAVNAPTVAIFGPTDEKKYGPLSDKKRVLAPKIDCRPCGKALCSAGSDEGCLPKIEVEEVFEAVKEVLKLGNNPAIDV